MRLVLMACVLLAVRAAILIASQDRPPPTVLYRFPKGFRGDWFVLQGGEPASETGDHGLVLKFTRSGICRVEDKTFKALHGWKIAVCRVGAREVETVQPIDFVKGKVSCDLGGYEAGDKPPNANAAPAFYFGFIGDLEELKFSSSPPQSSRERLQHALQAERGGNR